LSLSIASQHSRAIRLAASQQHFPSIQLHLKVDDESTFTSVTVLTDPYDFAMDPIAIDFLGGTQGSK
jgi:hypothetical protein